MQRRHFVKTLGAALPGLSAAGLVTGLKPVWAQAASVSTARPWQNWSGLQNCHAHWFTPKSVAELAAYLPQAATPIRPVGTGHSFSPLVPTEGTLLSLDGMTGILQQDRQQKTLRVAAGTRIFQAAQALDQSGLAFHNLPDISMQTLGGALATATHGTGMQYSALHADVVALTLVTPQGKIIEASNQHRTDIFRAAQVNLGVLGVITDMTMQVRPRFSLRRRVYPVPLSQLYAQAYTLAKQHAHFEAYVLPHTGYAAIILHDETDAAPTVRAKPPDEDTLADLRTLRDYFSRVPRVRRFVAGQLIARADGEDVIDTSWKMLTSHRPTRFNESECHVPVENGLACLQAVVAQMEKRNEVFFPIEFRFVKADQAWLSPFTGRNSCSIAVHAAHDEPWQYLLKELGPLFRRFGGRPHWGKLHDFTPVELRQHYPHWGDFLALRKTLDPQGKLLNPYLRQLLV